MNGKCPVRQNDGEHCYHTYIPTFQSMSGSVIMPSICCFCAPTYMHINVIVTGVISDEDITAEQLQHGHLITIQRRPKAGPKLAVVGGR